jgi:hypothetical protein
VTRDKRHGWKLTKISCDDGNSTVDLQKRTATIRFG